MNITYFRHAWNPRVSDEITGRVTRALELVEQKHGELEWNDIAAAFGGILVEFLSQVPDVSRDEARKRFVDVLTAQT